MGLWVVRRDGGIDNYMDDVGDAWDELRDAKEEAQDDIANGCFDEDGFEYAALYRFDPVDRCNLADGANVPLGDLFLRVKVAWVELRILGEAGDGSEAGRKADAAGFDFWAEAVIVGHKEAEAEPEPEPEPKADTP